MSLENDRHRGGRAAPRPVLVLALAAAVTGCQGNVGGTPLGADADTDPGSATTDPSSEDAPAAPDAGTVPPPLDGGTPAGHDAGAGPTPDAGPPPPPPSCATTTEAGVIALVNDARSAADLAPLRCDPALGAVARAHSRDMGDRGSFAHVNPEGESPFDRMADAGIRYRRAGENIARGQPTPEDVHRSWMNSTGHRRNILDRDYGRIGVGYVACDGPRRHYWTQVFAD